MEKALLLNSTYEPLGILSWKKALRLLCLEKVEVLESYPMSFRSEQAEVHSPSVMRLLKRVRWHMPGVRFSRVNIFRRDSYKCQYCGMDCFTSKATLDHVQPQSRGGLSSWENLVTCCSKCNNKKGNKTPKEAGMELKRKPFKPQWMDAFVFEAREEWKSYIFL